MRIALPLSALLVFTATPTIALGEDKKTEPLTPIGFVTEAMNNGLAEVALGKLAAEKATDSEVRRLGEKLAADHGRANKELARIAKDAKLAVPESVLGPRQKALDQFHGSPVKNFDAAYITRTVKDHEAAIELFTAASKQLKNEQLRAFAEKAVPQLKEHAAAARKISDRLSKQ